MNFERYANLSNQGNTITSDMYNNHHVFRGLRDMNGNGVVTGLTEISRIKAKEIAADGTELPCEGELYYRGYNVRELVRGFMEDGRSGFEEMLYLLLFSELPNADEYTAFRTDFDSLRTLPTSFVRDMILKAPGKDMMNILSRSVLALYAYDENPDDITIANVLRQCLFLASVFPMLAVYGYQSYQHYHKDKSLFIHYPAAGLSTAETFLSILREDGVYSPLEAKILDMSMALHAEHGGGNNSTFTMHVVTSSGTDTYSATAAALGSLKGPRHGGANVKVVQMFDDMKESINIEKEGEVRDYLDALLDRRAFDRLGLIYGLGHAVYSKSDPRADILRDCAESLVREKPEFAAEYELYKTVERIAPEIIAERRKIYKGVSANVDFYSGLIYRMLELPYELYTPLFAISRIAGWSAHRIEEIQNAGKIIRPAYTCVKDKKDYVMMSKR